MTAERRNRRSRAALTLTGPDVVQPSFVMRGRTESPELIQISWERTRGTNVLDKLAKRFYFRRHEKEIECSDDRVPVHGPGA